MPHDDAHTLTLLAEIDQLVDRLRRLVDDAPPWQPAQQCGRVIRRLLDRAEGIRLRLEAPLVVATLGGTGTGKSSLVNALVGEEVVATGRQRPTTTRPTLIARRDVTPELLGIDPATVDVIHRDTPVLRDLVLIDCPDPDTSEDEPEVDRASNLAALRAILPHCDVLIVTATQQKYRSARVTDELAGATRGCRVVFVQTHADLDADIRNDWRDVLREHGELGERNGQPAIFRVDLPAALEDAREGVRPRGEFGRLVDLLETQMRGAAGRRIRRDNFLELTADALDACRTQLDDGLPAVRQLQTALEEHRRKLTASFAGEMRRELVDGRRAWEQRLLARAVGRWGFSPFALLLRLYQGLGALLGGALLFRARSPAQLALLGAAEGARAWGRHRATRRADRAAERAVAAGLEGESLGAAALVLAGYVDEAGMPRTLADPDRLGREARAAGAEIVDRIGAELDALIGRLATRHTGWFTRLRYELLLLAMLGVLFYRLGKNFFWDSWLAPDPVEIAGAELYLAALFWLALWCVVLLWMFTARLRRGLRREIGRLAEGWGEEPVASRMFGELERTCTAAVRFRADVERLRAEVARLQNQVPRQSGAP